MYAFNFFAAVFFHSMVDYSHCHSFLLQDSLNVLWISFFVHWKTAFSAFFAFRFLDKQAHFYCNGKESDCNRYSVRESSIQSKKCYESYIKRMGHATWIKSKKLYSVVTPAVPNIADKAKQCFTYEKVKNELERREFSGGKIHNHYKTLSF